MTPLTTMRVPCGKENREAGFPLCEWALSSPGAELTMDSEWMRGQH